MKVYILVVDDEPKQAEKPERTIADLREGEIAFTPSWSLGAFRFSQIGIKV